MTAKENAKWWVLY